MEIAKYKSYQIMPLIRHNMRQLPPGKTYGNESVDLSLTSKNYSLINRGNTPEEVNQYRRNFENKIFKYNRKDLVHAISLVIQCPDDCPPEQHDAFFETAFNWCCNNYLPAGKECVFLAEVHKDEHKYIKTLQDGKTVLTDISKEHLHIAFVPAIPAGEKHPDYKYRLNSYQLTVRSILKNLHPSLQKAINDAGLTATVFRKKTDDGKTISLSIKQLKSLTEKTGIVIDRTLTLDELAKILVQNVELRQKTEELSQSTSNKDNKISELQEELKAKTNSINKLNGDLKSELQEKEHLQNQLQSAQDSIKNKELEIQANKEKLEELELKHNSSNEYTWGTESSWGITSNWDNNNEKTINIEEEKLW